MVEPLVLPPITDELRRHLQAVDEAIDRLGVPAALRPIAADAAVDRERARAFLDGELEGITWAEMSSAGALLAEMTGRKGSDEDGSR